MRIPTLLRVAKAVRIIVHQELGSGFGVVLNLVDQQGRKLPPLVIPSSDPPAPSETPIELREPPAPDDDGKLSKTDQAILTVLSSNPPLKVSTIAVKCNLTREYVRKRLYRLVRLGIVVKHDPIRYTVAQK